MAIDANAIEIDETSPKPEQTKQNATAEPTKDGNTANNQKIRFLNDTQQIIDIATTVSSKQNVESAFAILAFSALTRYPPAYAISNLGYRVFIDAISFSISEISFVLFAESAQSKFPTAIPGQTLSEPIRTIKFSQVFGIVMTVLSSKTALPTANFVAELPTETLLTVSLIPTAPQPPTLIKPGLRSLILK